ncbi:MAG: hypothetical protein JXR67_05680, partial [Bacteroidales bacterium]|nr:hypothetical protein [Bacteroidales bacterium]
MITAVVLLCFVVYAMSTRFMHILFSNPRGEAGLTEPCSVNGIETISQFVLLGVVVFMCFYQPSFLSEMIFQSISLLPK